MASIISTFHIDWKIIIAQAINFVIVLGVLYFYALKPLNKLMKERADKIAQGIQDAKSNADLLKQTEKESEATLAKANAEAQKAFQAGKKEVEVEKAKMIESAKLEVAAIIAHGKKTLEAEKTKMVEDARTEIVNLAMRATEKMLQTKMDKGFDERAVKELNNLK